MQRSIKLIIIILIFSSCNNYEKKMVKIGNGIVEKIELYKKENDTLPINLTQLAVDSLLYEKICYNKFDSINYIVWIGTVLGESYIYYSDTKTWEKSYRGFDK